MLWKHQPLDYKGGRVVEQGGRVFFAQGSLRDHERVTLNLTDNKFSRSLFALVRTPIASQQLYVYFTLIGGNNLKEGFDKHENWRKVEKLMPKSFQVG